MNGRPSLFLDLLGRLGCAWGVLFGLIGMFLWGRVLGTVAFVYVIVSIWPLLSPRPGAIVLARCSVALIVLFPLASGYLGVLRDILPSLVAAIVGFTPPAIGAMIIHGSTPPPRIPVASCFTCGYSLAGLAGTRCPECGGINAPTMENEPRVCAKCGCLLCGVHESHCPKCGHDVRLSS